MCKWLILLSALSVTHSSAAPAWTWVDEQGQVHYSDRPVPGAREIELSGAQGFSASPRTAPRSTQGSSNEDVRPAANYRTFNIVSPTEQETLWNIGANLTMRLELMPVLRAGHWIDLVLDGQRANLNVRGLEFSVPNVFRGTHSAAAVIVDANGFELQRSPAVSFIVQQTSIQNPSSPQAQRARGNQSAN